MPHENQNFKGGFGEVDTRSILVVHGHNFTNIDQYQPVGPRSISDALLVDIFCEGGILDRWTLGASGDKVGAFSSSPTLENPAYSLLVLFQLIFLTNFINQ